MTERLQILQGDWIKRIHELPNESVQCCVTSPPYWGLRDYKAKGQIGLEKTPEEYVVKLVAGFREVRRVLKDDGTLWLNLGDCYCANGKGGRDEELRSRGKNLPRGTSRWGGGNNEVPGLKCKDLVGIPWLVAFALRADGWYLRSDIIWAKANCMPESVKDRPTKSHEYIFLFSKARRYFYDAEAIAEPVSPSMLQQIEQGYNGEATKDFFSAGAQNASEVKSRIIQRYKDRRFYNAECVTERPDRNFPGGPDRCSALLYPKRSGNKERKPASDRGVPVAENGGTNGAVAGSVPWEGFTRNKRSVWTVTTHPYPEHHFATFPEDLIRPCILAASRPNDIVLDPFAGSGTTGLVALERGRKAILIELNPDYISLIEKRTDVTPGLPL
jgi:DNA modification methylase